jgi:CheY-like chemotaxis protein
MERQGTDKNSLKASSSGDFKIKGNVLPTEDNCINQEVGRGMLRAIVYHAPIINNEPEALQALANHYDLIQMDSHMPEMDSIQATSRYVNTNRQGSINRACLLLP